MTTTENAFTLNMEMGVLVSGGGLSAQAERHFERLIDARRQGRLDQTAFNDSGHAFFSCLD